MLTLPINAGGESLTKTRYRAFLANGSADLYLQAESPGKGKEANWPPAPKARFIPMLRLYWPNEMPPSIIDRSREPPVIEQVS